MKKILYKISRKIVRLILFLFCKIVYRFKVIGKKNIPKTGSVIFCANHRNLIDAPLMEVTCQRPDTRFLAKEELAKNPYIAHLGRVFNVILVKRNDKDLGPMKEALKTLKYGNAIALFPEGTRNGIKKGIKPKTGAAYFALNSDATIVPVGIKGGERPFKKMIITYGNPINIDEYKLQKKEKETAENVTEIIMNNIKKIIE